MCCNVNYKEDFCRTGTNIGGQMKIGIVLAGGMNKGFYEIGCLNAIFDFFGRENIECISASSIGTITAYSAVTGQNEYFINMLKDIDIRDSGRFFPSFSGNSELMQKIRSAVTDDNTTIPQLYITIWNYTQKKVEYVPIHTLTKKEIQNYLCASVAIPIFNKGVKINGSTIFDGAFIDNIPVFPLLEKEFDYIFCIYFDLRNYFFENEKFDRKIIKLYDFPSKRKLDNFVFDPNHVDVMVEYGYNYTNRIIRSLFSSADKDIIDHNIEGMNEQNNIRKSKRFTSDIILTNLNKVTSRLAKRNIL